MPSAISVTNPSPVSQLLNPYKTRHVVAGATILLWDSGGLYYARFENSHGNYQFFTCEERAVWLVKMTWLLAWKLNTAPRHEPRPVQLSDYTPGTSKYRAKQRLMELAPGAQTPNEAWNTLYAAWAEGK